MNADHIAELAQQLGQLLLEKNYHITTAESCTSGGIAYAITEVSGSSGWFERSFVTYSNEAKEQMLGVSATSLQEHGAVSLLVVEQMVSGAVRAANAEVGVAVSGIAGPDGGTDEKPVGTVCFGYALNGELSCEKMLFSGDRRQVREKTIVHAMTKCIELLET